LPYADLASVSFLACVVLFICPDGKGGKLLDWETAVSVHWGVFILFAGGIAIASALTQTGISAALGQSLGGLSSVHPFIIILAVCFAVTFLTEITSNTATATMLMPILAAAGVGAGVDPKLLMIPAALSASCAFMLPVATAPNAIVFSADRMKVQDMAREGFGLNIIAALAIATIVYVVVG
jgi:sodium-dependent dicarboxylate transporter 2/3/5